MKNTAIVAENIAVIELKDNTLTSMMDWMVDEVINKINSDKETNLKIAFKKIFGKPLDINKVYKRRMVHFVNAEAKVEHYCYCNRVFMIVREHFDTEKLSWVLDFEIPPKLYYTRKNNKVKFIDKSK